MRSRQRAFQRLVKPGLGAGGSSLHTRRFFSIHSFIPAMEVMPSGTTMEGPQ
jgi:hypothetical protein